MMKKLLPALILLATILYLPTRAQTVSYNDVGVIVNMNSDTSIQVANYFVAKRHIPAINVIPVYTDTAEEISNDTFVSYYTQIQNYLNNTGLASTLNYLVTTKGCPLKINRLEQDCDASCESELMLLTPGLDSYIDFCYSDTAISDSLIFVNPYYRATDTFSQQEYAIYLVTRLDAYTMQNIFNMIDSSGPNTYVNKDSVLFVLNQSPHWEGNPLNANLVIAADTLMARGWPVYLVPDSDSLYATYQRNVLGYWSWGSNDPDANAVTVNAKPYNTWANASIAETGVSTGGRSFEPGTPYGQSLVADLLAEGCTAVKGYVYEPYTISIAHPDILFPHYTEVNADSTPKYNLAESYFAASEMIGWMDVVVGDPKSSIITKKVAQVTAVKEVPNNDWNVYPNPARNYITVASTQAYTASTTISLFDINGRQVLTRVLSTPQASAQLDISSLPPGVYNLQVQTQQEYFSQKVVILR